MSSPFDDAPDLGRLRFGFLAVGIALAIILVGVTLASFLGARALSDTVTRGQASVIRSSLADLNHRGIPDEAALAVKFDELEQLGLGVRYIGVLSRDTPDRPEVGTATTLPTPGELPRYVDDDIVELGRTVQLVTPLIPGPNHRPAGPPPDRRPPPHRGPPPSKGPQPGKGSPGHHPEVRPVPPHPVGHLLVEFEPVVRNELLTRSRRELAAGIAGSLVILLVSFGFWRLALQSELAKQRLTEQRRLAALGEMSAVLAHELRNPLASLKGHAQLLVEHLDRGRADPERIRRKAGRVVDEALRLEQLSEGLLAFVRIGEVVREPTCPAALVESAADDLERERIDIETSEAPPAWALDSSRIRQVLTNLIDNALQAAPDQHVNVRVRAEGRTLEFRVRDRGPGVPADQRARIFEPFVTTRTRGTGLGLAISRRIVELHEGTIEVGEAPGGGAEFRVRIPRERSA